MGLGTLLSGGSLLLSGIQYNRDGYSDNVQMRQAQMYQEKNYYITWIAAVREEVRDIMTIFVGRMSNYNVVSTLTAAIVAGAICEGEPAEGCPDFVVHAFYLSMYISGMYLFMAVMYAARGMTVAYKSGMAFLVAVVPDPLDKYDHEYMQQVTRNFERDLWQVARPPLYDLFMGVGQRAQATRGKKQAGLLHKPGAGGHAGGPAKTGAPHGGDHLLERLPRGGGEPMNAVALRAAAAAGLKGSESMLPRTVSGLDAVEEAEAEQTGGRDDRRVSSASYFESLRMYSELWEPFAIAAEESLAHGVLSLAHGSIYYCLGRLYDRSERWAALTILCMFAILAVVMFSDGGMSAALCRDEKTSLASYSIQAGEEEAWSNRGRTCGMRFAEGLVLFLIVAGPAAQAAADRVALPWMDAIFIPMSYVFHVSLSMTFSIFALRCTCQGMEMAKAGKSGPGVWYLASPKPAQGGDVELGGVGDAVLPPAAAKCTCASEVRGELGEEGLVARRPSTSSTASGPTQGLAAKSLGANCRECLGGQVRQDPEALLVDLLQRSREEIRTNLKMLRVSSGLVHGIAALAWLSIFFWSLFIYVRFSEAFTPLASVQDQGVVWPSPHFRPTAMACAKGHVFVSDRFGVYELAGTEMRPLPCNLSHSLLDVAAACEGPRCWPLALTRDGGPSVTNCVSGATATLLQAPGAPAHVASLGNGSLAVVHGGELFQYRWEPIQKGFRPLWPLADVEARGLRAVDVAEDADGVRRLVAFRSADEPSGADGASAKGHQAGARRSAASVEVSTLDVATSSRAPASQRFVRRLPHDLPPLRGGCVADESSLLVLLQGAGRGAFPMLGKLRLDLATGALA